MTKRREFIQYAGLASMALASPALSFASRAERRPFEQVPQRFAERPMRLEGDWPSTLKGKLYRNSPAMLERAGFQHSHLFDGDGMVQQYTIANGQVSHRAEMVATEKYLREQAAGRFLYPGLGSTPPQPKAARNNDSANSANISVRKIGKRLFALWEAGSAYEIDPDSLATVGRVDWGEALTHLPFSAHPTIDADGQWWNIGSWIYGGQALVFIYQLDQAGALKRFKRLALQQAGYMHAFCVSQNYLVLVNTAHLYQHKNEGNFFDKFQFDQQGHSQIVLIDKNTLTIERTIEIPANFVFHFGNAYELGNELFFTMAEYRDAQIMSRGLSIKETSVFGPNPVSYPSELCQYRIELNSGRWHKSGSGLSMEFPNFRQTQPFSPQALVGCGQRLNHGGQQRLEQLLQINPHTGTSDAYTFAENVSLDEPLYIQDSRGEEFIIHSFLDRQQNESGLALFKGADIGAGPIAKAWAGGVLPQGFHGCWVSA